MASGPHNYDLFAEAYNRWMAEDFCRRALPAVERLLLARVAVCGDDPAGSARTDFRPGRRPCDGRTAKHQFHILDLCCGSGQMARALTARGFRVTGLDASAPMLRLARKNAPGAEFIRADMRRFRLPPQFAGALCAFNSLAHLAGEGELKAVFQNVRAALLPGAPFLFDISLEEAYGAKWRGGFTLVAEEQACIVRPSYDAERRLGRNHVCLLQARLENGRKNWIRSDFCIEQHCHSPFALRAALRAAGFRQIETFDGQRDLGITGERGRAFFLCR